jgi:DNA-binding GntR family transcriptional regulator
MGAETMKISESDYAKMQAQSAKERADLHPESVKYFLVTRDEMHSMINSAVGNAEKVRIYGDVVSRPAGEKRIGLPYPVVEVAVIALAKGIYAVIKAIINGISVLLDYIEKQDSKTGGKKS